MCGLLSDWRRLADAGITFAVVLLLWSLGTAATVLAMRMTCCPDAHGDPLFRVVVSGIVALAFPAKFLRR